MDVPTAFEPVRTEFTPWTPWHVAPTEAKVALISTGGIYLKKGLHQPFDTAVEGGDPSFREFPAVVATDDLAIAPFGYDTTYAEADINVVFPLQRLQELAAGGYIGAVAPFAYSFMGHVTRPLPLVVNYAPSVAYRMRRMWANLALVVAVGELGHQTAALVARAVELAGVPTVVLGTQRWLLESAGAPRSVVVQHPAGAPLGNPGNAGKHQHLLREVLDAAWQLEGPRLVVELPYVWRG
jgi:D-proline reductase (dithiol) PrdB